MLLMLQINPTELAVVQDWAYLTSTLSILKRGTRHSLSTYVPKLSLILSLHGRHINTHKIHFWPPLSVLS